VDAALGTTAAGRTGGAAASAGGGRQRPGVGQAGPNGPHRLGWLGQSKRLKPCWAGAVWGEEKRWAAAGLERREEAGPNPLLGLKSKILKENQF
jgi:hypothetical protein